MTNKYKLLFDAAKLMRSLADVVEAIAETYNDTVLTVDTTAAVIEAEEPKQIEEKQPKKEEKKELTFEEVRAVLATKSREGHAAEVKAILTEFGVEKISDIEPAQYEELLAKVEVI